MTVREYIAGKLGSLNLHLTDADWSDVSEVLDLDNEKTNENVRVIYKVLVVSVLPFYVNQAKSASENGFSVSFDKDGLMNFYAWLCKSLGIKDNLTQKPRITFL